MTTASLRALQSLCVLDKTSLEVDVGEIPKYNGRDIPKMFEDIREYLTCLFGFIKIQLLYIIRNTLIPPLSSDDDETNYVDKNAEMISRAPILDRCTIAATDKAGLALQATNEPLDLNAVIYQRLVYVFMQTVFGTHPVWQFTAGQCQSKIGIFVYWFCHNNILGKSMVNNMASNLLSDIQASCIEENQ